MKQKVYNIAAMACVCLIALGGNSFAQQSSSNSSSSTTTTTAGTLAVPPTPPSAMAYPGLVTVNGQNAISGYTAYTPPPASVYSFQNGTLSPLASVNGVYYLDAFGGSQDSTYLKKMKKLQEQMRDLQKEMNDARLEENKKRVAEIQKRNAERQAEMQKKYAEAFALNDKKFADKFSAVGTRYNSERNDADLEKKVQSGDVKLKTKSYTKTYPVDANDKLSIDNKFGKITINAWNKNEVKVDVDIKAYADDDDKATDLLNLVSINDSKNGDGVSFTTKIDEGNNRNTWFGTMTSNGKTSVRKTVINYTVYMPSKNALTIANSYGAVILPDMSGRIILKNQFGNVSAKALTNTGNDINVKYGDANIESLTGSDLNMQFGTLTLQSADRLNADLQYTPAKFGKLSNSATINARFGEGIQIATLDRNLKTLTITSSYAPVKLAALNDADFNVSTSYGGFTYDNNNVSVTSKSPGDEERSYSNSKTYKGHIGKGNSDKVITIKSTFSSVKFDQ